MARLVNRLHHRPTSLGRGRRSSMPARRERLPQQEKFACILRCKRWSPTRPKAICPPYERAAHNNDAFAAKKDSKPLILGRKRGGVPNPKQVVRTKVSKPENNLNARRYIGSTRWGGGEVVPRFLKARTTSTSNSWQPICKRGPPAR